MGIMPSPEAQIQNPYAKLKTMTAITVAAALLMVGVKIYLFFVTGAVSFLAVMLDSIMDVGLSVATFIGVYWASKPADRRHRYGYGKVEALLALFQSLLLSFAALSLAWEAGKRFSAPTMLVAGTIEIAMTVFILLVTVGLVHLQNKVVEQTNSLAIKGDRAHYTSDVFTNGGVLILLIVNHFMPVPWLDPLYTMGIAIYLLFNAYDVGCDAANMLLDKEACEELREEIFVAASMVKGVEGVHDLRVIDRGLSKSVSLDIVLDGDISVNAGHDIAKAVEMAILKISPDAEIMIHVDPVGDIEDSRHEELKPLHFT